MTGTETALESAALLKDPSLLLRGLDFETGIATLAPMTEETYARSVALDERIETAGADVTATLEALDRAVIAPNPGRRSLHFLFHKGYCGATLMSRVLGAADGLFALREPPVLDMLGREARRVGRAPDALPEDRWRWANTVNLHLMARCWRDDDFALVKAPAHCAEIMPGLVGWSPHCRAILLYVEIEPFIATALRDESWRWAAPDIETLYHPDFRDIAGDEAPHLTEMSRAQQAAMMWLVHGCEYRRMANDAAFEGRVLPVDFDTVLDSPVQALMQICAFLQKPVDAAAALAGPGGPMLRHADDPARPFGAAERKAELDAVRAAHGDEIDEALRWAEPWMARLGL